MAHQLQQYNLNRIKRIQKFEAERHFEISVTLEHSSQKPEFNNTIVNSIEIKVLDFIIINIINFSFIIIM